MKRLLWGEYAGSAFGPTHSAQTGAALNLARILSWGPSALFASPLPASEDQAAETHKIATP